ncbi:MAG TPA: thioredoxin domain-containing protein, partial [Fibrobacteria bacterium]|nr:thioredoxin domain-containing protein [Fibrobacteria bacterium]
MATMTHHTNRLIHETSPYLLQHAHNPVDWHAWGDEALAKAAREDKLLLVSIGYSACHWCHVMERESFEDESIAAVMNENFICVKVDREERPDVDQVYMNAVQLISGHGGWPLNCFALPDGRPVYGGTYFRPAQWKEVLKGLAGLWRDDRPKVLKYAEQLTEGVRSSERIEPAGGAGTPEPFALEEAAAMVEAWTPLLDRVEGGMNRAPKFPLPSNWRFLLRYAHAAQDEDLMAQARLTLDKMANWGIYDHLGGGFARYSTDSLWKVPHFEKMLYDNAQLLELYAEAYQLTGEPLYRKVVEETATFVERELTSPEGVFYSALDADSEGEEGKYYVWTKEELKAALGDRYTLIRDAYSVDSEGYWEEGNYILMRRKDDAALAAAAGLEPAEWASRLDVARRDLLALREKRVKPSLDDKSLTAWSAMMAKGLLTAHAALGEERHLAAARTYLEFLKGRGRREDGGLWRTYKSGRFAIAAFLEDYAFAADAFQAMYQATFEEEWLRIARELAEYAVAHFRDPKTGLFFFTSDLDKPLVARKMEIMDNVIPSSNAVLARTFRQLASLTGEMSYRDMAEGMLSQVRRRMPSYGSGFSHWGQLLLDLALPFHEVVITGPETHDVARGLRRWYLPDAVMA